MVPADLELDSLTVTGGIVAGGSVVGASVAAAGTLSGADVVVTGTVHAGGLISTDGDIDAVGEVEGGTVNAVGAITGASATLTGDIDAAGGFRQVYRFTYTNLATPATDVQATVPGEANFTNRILPAGSIVGVRLRSSAVAGVGKTITAKVRKNGTTQVSPTLAGGGAAGALATFTYAKDTYAVAASDGLDVLLSYDGVTAGIDVTVDVIVEGQ